MLIYKNTNTNYIFIHIPKNSGKYIRNKIFNDNNNEIVKSYWDIYSNLDLAHIPYIKKDEFIENNIEYNYFTYTRYPYDRIISGFFYKNPDKNIDDFQNFVKNTLILYDFSMNFNCDIIHYYPQYLFVCDENLNIPKNITISKLENLENPRKYNLSEYFDSNCINIINNIYIKDFLFFDYQMINGI